MNTAKQRLRAWQAVFITMSVIFACEVTNANAGDASLNSNMRPMNIERHAYYNVSLSERVENRIKRTIKRVSQPPAKLIKAAPIAPADNRKRWWLWGGLLLGVLLLAGMAYSLVKSNVK